MNSKIPLVIVPSPLIMARTYHGLAKRLAKQFEVHVPEMPGSGRRPSRDRTWKSTDYAWWLLRYLDYHKLSSAYFLGHSNSGAVVLTLAASAPDRVRGLILADTTGLNHRSYWTVLGARFLDLLQEPLFSVRAAPHLLNNVFRHTLNFKQQLRESIEYNVENELYKIRSPALVLWGRADRTMPVSQGYRLAARLPQTSLYVSPRGSHDWILTRPKESAQVITQWLRDAGSNVNRPATVRSMHKDGLLLDRP